MNKTIQRVSIHNPGDQSVWIHEYRVDIVDLDLHTDDYEHGELEEFREKLRDAFGVIVDGPVGVTFDIEEQQDEPKISPYYTGARQGDRRDIAYFGCSGISRLLDPRNDLMNHSPDGFGWGYSGSGPAQSALGILAHYFGHSLEWLALAMYQDFKFAIITGFKEDSWILDESRVEGWVEHWCDLNQGCIGREKAGVDSQRDQEALDQKIDVSFEKVTAAIDEEAKA